MYYGMSRVKKQLFGKRSIQELILIRILNYLRNTFEFLQNYTRVYFCTVVFFIPETFYEMFNESSPAKFSPNSYTSCFLNATVFHGVSRCFRYRENCFTVLFWMLFRLLATLVLYHIGILDNPEIKNVVSL